MLKLELTNSADRFLHTLDARQFRQIGLSILRLMRDPEPHDSAQLKGAPFRRVDVGEYRIVYRVDGDVLRVSIIGKRNDDEVYREVRRRLR